MICHAHATQCADSGSSCSLLSPRLTANAAALSRWSIRQAGCAAVWHIKGADLAVESLACPAGVCCCCQVAEKDAARRAAQAAKLVEHQEAAARQQALEAAKAAEKQQRKQQQQQALLQAKQEVRISPLFNPCDDP